MMRPHFDFLGSRIVLPLDLQLYKVQYFGSLHGQPWRWRSTIVFFHIILYGWHPYKVCLTACFQAIHATLTMMPGEAFSCSINT